MTHRISIRLVCDLCEQEAAFTRSDLAAARIVGERQGWISGSDLGVPTADVESTIDLCPACAEMYRRDTEEGGDADGTNIWEGWGWE
jgi:hypothetical protein